MKRNLAQLARGKYDILVIGGGIYGACLAWDATLRGLSVALVDQGDFGHATSANSLKIIHGGLRYLQDANLKLIRTMIRERTIWLRVAPHFVHPLPCLLPTTRKPARHKVALGAALRTNDLLGRDRNRNIDLQKRLPNGRLISREACLQLLPGVAAEGITGGAIWYDAQVYNTERLLLSFILAAAEAGADVANYVEVTGFLGDDRGINGVTAQDKLTNQPFDIRARLVVNSAGAWVDSLLAGLNGRVSEPKFHLSTAMNLVTRQIIPTYAAGVQSNYLAEDQAGSTVRRSQMLFIVPWRQYSLIGTTHARYAGSPHDFCVTEESIQNFIDEVNTAYPGAALNRGDVYHVHQGFLPMVEANGRSDGVRLVREGQIYDHQAEDGIAGLITVVGVKYTTARYVAQKAIDLAVKKLGRTTLPCQTHQTPIYGGLIERFDEFLLRALQNSQSRLNPEVVRHLVYSYGSAYQQILNYLDENPAWGRTVSTSSGVIEAEIIHAVRAETAQKLSDVIQRRTELGAAGLPDESCLKVCANLMATELGWSQGRKAREIDEVRAAYRMPTASIRIADKTN